MTNIVRPQTHSRSASAWKVKNALQSLPETIVSALMAVVILTAAVVLASVACLMAASVLFAAPPFRPSHQPV